MIEIKLIPYGEETPKKMDEYKTIASGKTWKDVLQNLIVAINDDEVDDVNNKLIIVS